jgi:hypothetical protein
MRCVCMALAMVVCGALCVGVVSPAYGANPPPIVDTISSPSPVHPLPMPGVFTEDGEGCWASPVGRWCGLVSERLIDA